MKAHHAGEALVISFTSSDDGELNIDTLYFPNTSLNAFFGKSGQFRRLTKQQLALLIHGE